MSMSTQMAVWATSCESAVLVPPEDPPPSETYDGLLVLQPEIAIASEMSNASKNSPCSGGSPCRDKEARQILRKTPLSCNPIVRRPHAGPL